MIDQQTTETVGAQRPGRPATPCAHWIGAERRSCGATEGVRQYLPGHRCPLHTPAALQGKPEPPEGPGWPIYRDREAQA